MCSGGSVFHPLSHTDAENLSYLAWTAPNSALNPWRVVVSVGCEQTWQPLWKQLTHPPWFVRNCHRCFYDRVEIRHTSRWLLISLLQSPHNAYQATALLQQYFFPFKINVWLTLETLFYPVFLKWQKLLHQNLCNFWTKRQIVMQFSSSSSLSLTIKSREE